MIQDLSDDELTVLMIAMQGEYMAPIGRWEAPIKRLAMLGYMHKLDDVNYVITPKGKARAEEQDDADAVAFIQLNNEMVRRKEKGDGASGDAECVQFPRE